MKKTLLLILDLFFLTRPIVIVPVWGFCAFGVYSARGPLAFLDARGYLLILLYSLSAASVYVINQMADREVDRANGGFPLLVRGDIPTKAAVACAAVCALLSIIPPLLMGHAPLALLSLTAIAAGYVYSCKPFSLSGRPVWDFLTNAFEALLAFYAGRYIAIVGLAETVAELPPEYVSFQWRYAYWAAHIHGFLRIPVIAAPYSFPLPYVLLMCAGSISSTLPDIPGDRAHGKITTAVRFGPKAAHRAALAFLLAAMPVSFFISHDPLALACAIAVIPTYIPYLANSDKKYMELPYKAGGAVIMLAAAFAVPLLLPAGLAVYVMTWLYFRKRHNVSYPSLKPGGADV